MANNAKHPHLASKAHNAVTRAVRSGKLIKPTRCSRCGSKGRIVAHHSDYAKPLDVEWLCWACHNHFHDIGQPNKKARDFNDANMKRTTIFLTDDQIRRLARMAERKGINVAQLIRVYINAGLGKEKP